MYFNSEMEKVKKWNIVVVDDDPLVLRVHAEMLRTMGHNISLFECPQQALKYFESKENVIDLLITDYRMPGLNGLELIARVQAEGFNVPAIILTAYINDVDAVQAEALGAKVVSKPLPIHLLHRHVISFQKE